MNPSRDSAHSRRSSASRRTSTDSSDTDIYDIDAAAVSDGFRPNRNAPRSPQARRPAPPPPLLPPPPIASSGISKMNGVVDRPTSTSKPPRPHDSLTIRNDGAAEASSSSPSHPYEMYLQRTASNATDSTRRNNRSSYQGPRGPAHPYSLYPQNTVTPEDAPQQQIPVGFQSGGTSYRRRVGPDGEEAGGLIGPLGHTEELPPYTRYPEVSVTNKPAPGRRTSQSSRRSQGQSSAVRAIPGAGGIGIATRNPEFSSTQDTLAASPSRESMQSDHEINIAAREYAEKPSPSKWERRAKRRLFGIIPYWAICLVVFGMGIMGIVMGVVIGTVLTKHSKGQADTSPPDADKPAATTTIIMVQPLQTPPPGLNPLDTGVYLLPPLQTTSSSTSCVSNSLKSPSWSCNMITRFYLMDIDKDSNKSDTDCYKMTLSSIPLLPNRFIWGTQPPEVVKPATLTLVNDTFDDNDDPAWWTSITYDKTVVLRDNALQISGKSKRDWRFAINDYSQDHHSRGPLAHDGECIWICTWPDTTMEIFVYPNKTAAIATPTSPLNPFAPTASGNSSKDDGDDDNDDDNAVAKDNATAKAFSPYPRAVKFLERRMPKGSATASCRKVTIKNGGRDVVPVMDPSTGQPLEVEIGEKTFDFQRKADWAEYSDWTDKRSVTVTRDTVDLTPCNCVWWSM